MNSLPGSRLYLAREGLRIGSYCIEAGTHLRRVVFRLSRIESTNGVAARLALMGRGPGSD
jgi:hypothetical protein